MKRSIFFLICVGLALQACQPLTGSQTPRRVATVTPTSGVTPSADSMAKIPLRVGRGVDGGWFQLYFTDPSDPVSGQFDGGPDLAVVQAIDNAEVSVDAALYSLTLYSVRRALIEAHRRGARVRVVMESDNMEGTDPQALKDAGIPLRGDRKEGLMHNKFIVIDQMEVWTGSMNMTDAGTYLDRNNLIRLQSTDIAADYEAEFEEMFLHDHFGPDVSDPTPQAHLIVDGMPVDIYYSPDDHPETILRDLLQGAKSSIYFLGYSFTSDPLSRAIIERAQAGVKVSGILDTTQARTNTGAEYDTFREAGLDVRLDGEDGLMHNKVLIIDGSIVVLGSYNFTASAARYNDENLVVLHSPEVASQYIREFRRIRELAQP